MGVGVVDVVVVSANTRGHRSSGMSSSRSTGMVMQMQQLGPRPGMRMMPNSPAPMPPYL